MCVHIHEAVRYHEHDCVVNVSGGSFGSKTPTRSKLMKNLQPKTILFGLEDLMNYLQVIFRGRHQRFYSGIRRKNFCFSQGLVGGFGLCFCQKCLVGGSV